MPVPHARNTVAVPPRKQFLHRSLLLFRMDVHLGFFVTGHCMLSADRPRNLSCARCANGAGNLGSGEAAFAGTHDPTLHGRNKLRLVALGHRTIDRTPVVELSRRARVQTRNLAAKHYSYASLHQEDSTTSDVSLTDSEPCAAFGSSPGSEHVPAPAGPAPLVFKPVR